MSKNVNIKKHEFGNNKYVLISLSFFWKKYTLLSNFFHVINVLVL